MNPKHFFIWMTPPISGEVSQKGGEGSGNFGHAGRPGKIGGSQSSGSPEGALSRSLFHKAVQHGGFTYRPRKGAPKTGIAVACHQECVAIYPAKSFTWKNVLDYIKKNRDILSKEPDAHLGGWFDTDSGNIVLDVSTVVKDRERAVQLAREHKQKAVFDLGTFTEIPVGADEGRISGSGG